MVQAREENTFKSIPDLSRAEAEPEAGLYSLYCARSLGYIPGPGLETADTTAEAWSRARTPGTRRVRGLSTQLRCSYPVTDGYTSYM